ncbi:BadM/Rrf2 family transcriptional regulator [Anseongella ginsenosidimutans]|uniref:BadM/Rrf2 family transcriptional regulator n=1 Tax=Anseongella ginsenosidimutans TaxID=496056 RepID=A0A4R3KNY4_9SPHI|nr:Rrf2 family transcriptional regulator [Anseongella ginsenosidimutans]TCS86268.1 BadM/Rrf2 family transcriptional regulator [Anseongella ginsenosidimutans]
MLSKKTKYAIKALVALAKSEKGVPVLISRLAEEEKIPKKFLELILLELRNAGVLHSKKGAGGGYYMAKDPAEVKLVQILRVTDGPIALLPCVSLNFYERCDECKDEVTCGIRNVFIDVRDAALQILTETSIADIVSREKELSSSLKLTP